MELIIIFLLVFFLSLAATKKTKNKPNSKATWQGIQSTFAKPSSFAAPSSSVKSASSDVPDVKDLQREVHIAEEKEKKVRGIKQLALVFEDRKNDWLARQRREEAALYRKGPLSDLGAAHNQNCDADSLKREHHLVHDDSIDTGRGR